MTTFLPWHIALTAGIASVVSLLLLWVGRRWFKMEQLFEMVVLAIIVGFSVLAWRSAGNTAVLNVDPILAVSPNDVLCPVITYVFLGMYGALHYPRHDVGFERARVVLTLVSFAVNVITI